MGCAAPDVDEVDSVERERSADELPLVDESSMIPCGASGPDLLTLAWVDGKTEALVQPGDDLEQVVSVADVALLVRNDSQLAVDGEVWVRVVGGGLARERSIAAVMLEPGDQAVLALDPALLNLGKAESFLVAGSLSARVEFSLARQTAEGEPYEQREAQGTEPLAWRPVGAGQIAWMTQAYADKAVREGAAWVDPTVAASMAQALLAQPDGVPVHVWQYAVELDEEVVP